MTLSFRSMLLVRDTALKSELLSPPVAPVGSLHASRHQATVMERGGGLGGGGRRVRAKMRSEDRRERNGKAETSGGDNCITKE